MKHTFAVIVTLLLTAREPHRPPHLLLTMRQRVDVKADEFHDSLGPVAEVVGP